MLKWKRRNIKKKNRLGMFTQGSELVLYDKAQALRHNVKDI